MRPAKVTKMMMMIALAAISLSSLSAQNMKMRMNSENGGMRMGDQMAPEAPHMRMMEIPDLTDDQKNKMEDIHLKYQKQIQPLQNQIGEKEARLRTLMSEEKVNKSDVYKVVEDIGDLQTKIRKLHIDMRIEVSQILTDKQKVFMNDGPGIGPMGDGMRHRMQN